MIGARCQDCQRRIAVAHDLTSGRFRRLETRPAIGPGDAIYLNAGAGNVRAAHPHEDGIKRRRRELRLHRCTLPPGSAR